MNRITEGTYGTMYYVRDMKKAVAYYQALGLKARFESNEWTEFDLGDGSAICLHIVGDIEPLVEGGTLIAKVKGIKTLVPMLKQNGIEFVQDIKEVHPGAFFADFKDPWGNVLSLYEDTNSYGK